MRKKLSDEEGERKRFMAVVSRFGKKAGFKGYSQETLLLTNVRDATTQAVVTSHVWFTYVKVFQALPLREGTVIEFEARVKRYTKGYVNPKLGINQRKTDYKLSHPTKVKIV